jgi:prefoldin subunit 5
MATLNAINYQISQLHKQIVKLEMKRATISKSKDSVSTVASKTETYQKFLICDDQENFCLGNIYELEKYICNCECPVYWT